MPLAPRPMFRRLMPGLALAVALAVGGCVGNTPYDDLASAQPTGSPFSRALFKDYAYLARSYGIANRPRPPPSTPPTPFQWQAWATTSPTSPTSLPRRR